MDRLKAIPEGGTAGSIADLHSSMDRLKARYKIGLTATPKNLHSSMDRLKGYSRDEANDEIISIYIPVWID